MNLRRLNIIPVYFFLAMLTSGCGFNLMSGLDQSSALQPTSPKTVYKDFVYVPTSQATAQVYGFLIDPITGHLSSVPNSGSDFFGGGLSLSNAALSPLFSQSADSFFLMGDLAAPSPNTPSFAIDPKSGGISLVGTYPSSVSYPAGLTTIDPLGRFLFVPALGGGDVINAYTINTATGALTQTSPPAFATLSQPLGITIDAPGNNLYLSYDNTNSISRFPINSDGTLGARTDYVAGSGSYTNRPVISPDGTVLALVTADSKVVSFHIAGDGTLTAKSTLAAGNDTSEDIAFDLTGRCLFVPDGGGAGNGVWLYTVAGDGTLAPSSPSQADVGVHDGLVTYSPDKKYLLVNQNDQYVSVFTVQSSNCSLTPVANSPFYISPSYGGFSAPLRFTQGGDFAVLTAVNGNVILSLAYDSSSGALTPADTASTGSGFTFAPTLVSIPQ